MYGWVEFQIIQELTKIIGRDQEAREAERAAGISHPSLVRRVISKLLVQSSVESTALSTERDEPAMGSVACE